MSNASVWYVIGGLRFDLTQFWGHSGGLKSLVGLRGGQILERLTCVNIPLLKRTRCGDVGGDDVGGRVKISAVEVDWR